MASRSTIVVDTPDLVIVRVDHGIADSFSRSVAPTTARGWSRAINCTARANKRIFEFAPDWTVDGTRCVSFGAFGTSHEAARGGLAAYLDSVRPAHDLTTD